jgi:DNA-binding MarR family transcriptional regulator
LYGSIRELSEQGAIEPLEDEADAADDQRRRYYRLTPRGRELLRSEAERLQALVHAAYTSRALGEA